MIEKPALRVTVLFGYTVLSENSVVQTIRRLTVDGFLNRHFKLRSNLSSLRAGFSIAS